MWMFFVRAVTISDFLLPTLIGKIIHYHNIIAISVETLKNKYN